MKYAPWLLAVLVAALWLKAHDASVRADALAEARRDSLETALASVERVTLRLAAADSALAVHEAADRARLAASRRALAVATAQRDSTAAVLDSVLLTLPDTAPLHIAITRERDYGVACRGALNACTDLALTLTARIDTLTAERDLLRPALTRTTYLWREAEKRRNPSLFGRLRIALPFVIGGVAIWELVR